MKEIGGILNVSEKTVMFHKYHIMRCHNLKSNADVVLAGHAGEDRARLPHLGGRRQGRHDRVRVPDPAGQRDRIDRMNRQAELEKAPDDPQQPVDRGDSKPLIVMICAALAATVMVLGIMWVNDTNRSETGAASVAQSQH